MAFSKEGSGKPTPASGDQSTARKPEGFDEGASGVVKAGTGSEFPLRPDSAYSSLLPATQVSGSDN